MELKDKIKDELTPFFIKDNRILSIYLLGCIVNGNFNDNSDIDIALMLYPEMDINPMELLEISSVLSIKLGRRVDLGLLSSKNLIYVSEVLYKGEILFTKSEDDNNLNRVKLLSLYLSFNDERKEVLDAYRT